MSADDIVTSILVEMDEIINTLPREIRPDEIHRKEQRFFHGLIMLERHGHVGADDYADKYIREYLHPKLYSKNM
jgi:hypothetical protein